MKRGETVETGVSKRLKESVLRHYEQQLERYGPTARGMDWKDEDSQRLRFEVLCGVCDLDGRSVHEVAAGAGHLYDFLKERAIASDYSGSDLSAAMVEASLRRHPEVCFERRDVLDAAEDRYDVVVCSGLFHVKLRATDGEWLGFIHESLRRMYGMCRVAIAFNVMSDQVDYRVEELFYANAGGLLDFCRGKLSRHVTLRKDYPLHEYTVYVYRDAPVA